MKQGINQTGPTCGLYSILNGLLIMNKISNPKKEKIDKEIYELLKNFKFEIKDEKLTGYTLVGEFFIFDIFTKFIKDVIHKLHNNLILGGIDSVDNNFKYEIEVISVSDLTK